VSRRLVSTQDELVETIRLVPTLGATFGRLGAARSMLFFSRMITNGEQSIRQLSDSFGISAEEVIARSRELVEAGEDQQQAFRQAITEEMLETYNNLGLQQVTAAERVMQTNAAIDDQRSALQQALVPLTEMINEGLRAAASWEGWRVVIQGVTAPIFALIGGFRGLIVVAALWATAVVEAAKAVSLALEGRPVEAAQQLENAIRIGTEGALQGLLDSLDSVVDRWAEMGEQAQEPVGEEAFGDTGDAAQGAEESVERLAEQVDELSDIQADFGRRSRAVWEQYQDKVEDASQRASDSLRDAQIELQRDLADLQIELERKAQDIERRFQQARQKANRQLATTLLDIERSYQKKRRDILREFARSEREAIEDRDALALVRARERKDEQLEKAKEERDEQRDLAHRRHQEQLRMAEEARRRDLEDLGRYRQRKEQELRIGLRREEWDIRRSLQRKERDLQTWRIRELNDLDRWLRRRLIQYRAGYSRTEKETARHLKKMSAMFSTYRNTKPGTFSGSGAYPMADGGEGVVTQPTMFLAGEAGPEFFQFRPLGGSQAAQRGSTCVRVVQDFTFNGSFSDREREWFKAQARAQAIDAIGEALA